MTNRFTVDKGANRLIPSDHIRSLLRKRFRELGIKQVDLARSAGMSKGMLNLFLNGKANLTIPLFCSLCRALDIDIVAFIEQEGKLKEYDYNDLHRAAWDFIEAPEAEHKTRDELKRMFQAILIKIPWEDLSPEEARLKALTDDPVSHVPSCTSACRELAEDKALWEACKITGEDVHIVEDQIKARRRGTFKGKHDWLNSLRQVKNPQKEAEK